MNSTILLTDPYPLLSTSMVVHGEFRRIARAEILPFLAEGLAELERDLGARMPFRIRTTRAIRRKATPLYLGSLAGLTASFLALLVR